MNARERVKLLHGPYRTPPLRVGQRADCLLRDALCVVTSYSAGRIPWPRGRALDRPSGGTGLLLLGDLVKAVRQESAAAICHWWGVSSKAVWHWRDALGVTKFNNAGTQRLVRAAARMGAAAVAQRYYSAAEREERRRRAIDNNQARYLTRQPGWPDDELRLLGTVPDEEVAKKIGRTVAAVRVMRARLGIANPAPRKDGWTAEEDALVLSLRPTVAAVRLQRSLAAIYARRWVLGLREKRAENRLGKPSAA